MKIIGHRQIRPDWHILTTEHGTFFGYSERDVRERADAHRRARLLHQAETGRLPLHPRQHAVQYSFSQRSRPSRETREVEAHG